MHELSIAIGIIDVAEEEAERRQAALIAIHVKIGALSGVVPRALVSAYELAREGTAAANCELVIEETPVVIHCPACGVDVPVVSVQLLECSLCGKSSGDVVSGRELEVTAVELEYDHANPIG
jgi:hydrogenase nickel incorporation protein HypA/HybF